MRAMPDFHNKEAVSQFIASSMMDLTSDHAGGLVKRLMGVSEELSYVTGMKACVSIYAGFPSWDIDREATKEKGLGKDSSRSSDLLLNCFILNTNPNKVNCYLVEYEFIMSSGERTVREAWVSEKYLVPQIEL